MVMISISKNIVEQNNSKQSKWMKNGTVMFFYYCKYAKI